MKDRLTEILESEGLKMYCSRLPSGKENFCIGYETNRKLFRMIPYKNFEAIAIVKFKPNYAKRSKESSKDIPFTITPLLPGDPDNQKKLNSLCIKILQEYNIDSDHFNTP